MAGEIHKDVNEIMAWPLHKIYEYMAYYLSQTDDFKQKIKDEVTPPEVKRRLLIDALKASMGK